MSDYPVAYAVYQEDGPSDASDIITKRMWSPPPTIDDEPCDYAWLWCILTILWIVSLPICIPVTWRIIVWGAFGGVMQFSFIVLCVKNTLYKLMMDYFGYNEIKLRTRSDMSGSRWAFHREDIV